MIRSFRGAEPELVWQGIRSRKLPPDTQSVALRKLMIPHRARTLNDLRVPPANRLEPLKGKRAGRWSIRIDRQWRVRFRWREGDAYDVEIVDYHDE